ncbi:MAG: hypothetical protein H0X03_04155, partial [Nitrosopumilus sp.]|nr:hypothetical protein [Nitrosopumilus sp.]
MKSNIIRNVEENRLRSRAEGVIEEETQNQLVQDKYIINDNEKYKRLLNWFKDKNDKVLIALSGGVD